MLQKYLKDYKQPILSLPTKYFLNKIYIVEQNNIFNIQLNIGFFLNEAQKKKVIMQLSNYLWSKNIQNFKFEIHTKVDTHKINSNLNPINGVKNIIAIASSKGGVGKSTTTANLAISLQKMGANVGILDADIYGPSQPLIMGNFDHPFTSDKKKIEPIICHGIKMISVGNLISQDSAVIWRGPMASNALIQLINDTNWENLDYLFIDLPPGTGDIQLTMTKKIPVTTVVIVTTPQDLSLIDAKRAIVMFNKLKIHNLGIVENMGIHICENCGHTSAIFGQAGANKLCQQFNIPFLGSLPLDIFIRKSSDNGMPVATYNNDIATHYQKISLKIAASITKLPEITMLNIPGVKVEFDK